LACGDSLYGAGKGVSYGTYSAPLPGNLLIFGTSEDARLLAEELARSGHEVQFVSNANELAQQLESGDFVAGHSLGCRSIMKYRQNRQY
jgi:hypothetical protein